MSHSPPSHATLIPCSGSSGAAGRAWRLRGAISLLVLLILGVAVMLAGIFVALMATQRAIGVRQTAAQQVAQTALAGALYAEQILMSDYQAAFNGGAPQRFPDVHCPDPTKRYAIANFGGMLPATSASDPSRIGLNWKYLFDGRIGSADGSTAIAAAGTSILNWPANQFQMNATTVITDTKRPAVVDSMDPRILAIPLRYLPYRNGWYSSSNANGFVNGKWQFVGSESSGIQADVYGNAGAATWPRWFTLAYLDQTFNPIPVGDADQAAYESRVAIMTMPLDGCLNINFGTGILSRKTGGRFRYGLRTVNIPADPLEVSAGDQSSALTLATNSFQLDARDLNTGATTVLRYPVLSTISQQISSANGESAFLISASDTAWTGAGFPLAQQYGTALGQMLGAMSVSDGVGTVSVKKNSSLQFTGAPSQIADPTKYTWTGAAPTVVAQPSGKIKASAGTGMLTRIMNIALGQGYLGNAYNYDLAGNPGSAWYQPTAPMQFQPGPNATWQQFQSKMGWDGAAWSQSLTQSLNSENRNIDIVCFALTPFGISLDKSKSPIRNRGDGSLADIDCPWFVNVMMINRDVAQAMVAGMTSDYFMKSSMKWRNNTGVYPMNSRNLLPIPPRKTVGGDTAHAAVWDDGMAKTGADGAEGGALPPLSVMGAFLRPPNNSSEATNYFTDAFAGNAYKVWRNPVRDELVAADESKTDVIGYTSPTYTSTTRNTAYCFRGMNGINPGVHATATLQSGDDLLHVFVAGTFTSTSATEAHAFENRPIDTTEFNLRDNADTMDERLSYQNDITAALFKTLVDCLGDRTYGKRLTGKTWGYDKIEDVETVFLAHLGIAVHYKLQTSHASTAAMSSSDYDAPYPNATPQPPNASYPLGQFNQLYAMGQLTTSFIRSDRSAALTTTATTAANKKFVNANGDFGQRGFRHFTWGVRNATDARLYDSLGWPSIPINPALDESVATAAGDYMPYDPTWAALSRVLEHRLNDVRMSLFGTPALDFNGDSILDATTVAGTGEVGADPQLHFSCTGRWSIGRNQLWRVFVKAELWDRRNDRLADEASLERVMVVDPNGQGFMDGGHTIFSRWHGNPVQDGRVGPTSSGRTQAFAQPATVLP